MTKKDNTRIYLVEGDDRPRLVSASHPRIACNHVSGSRFKARVPTQRELISLRDVGTQIEEASESQPE